MFLTHNLLLQLALLIGLHLSLRNKNHYRAVCGRPFVTEEFRFDARLHDDGVKVLLNSCGIFPTGCVPVL